MTFPAFVGGLPGGTELAVVFGILLTFAILAYALFAGGRAVFGGERPRSDLEARVRELEDEVADLQRRLDERGDEDR